MQFLRTKNYLLFQSLLKGFNQEENSQNFKKKIEECEKELKEKLEEIRNFKKNHFLRRWVHKTQSRKLNLKFRAINKRLYQLTLVNKMEKNSTRFLCNEN